MEFTGDWFSHNIPVWQRILGSLGWLDSSTTNISMLEVGSWEGRSAVWAIQHICVSEGSRLVCIDTWRGAPQYSADAKDWGLDTTLHSGSAIERRFDANISAALQRSQYQTLGRIKKIKAASHLGLAQLLSDLREPAFQIIYIDGSHEPIDVLTDAVLAWQLLLVGGVLILDDYMWHNIIGADSNKCPKPAIDAFLEIFGDKFIVLELKYQCIVQKIQ